MQEVEVCDRVIIINKGQIVADKTGPLNYGKQRAGNQRDYKIEEQAIAKMPHLKSYKTRTIFMGINFIADKDMRPTVFDFMIMALKTLQLNQKNKNLEAVFREITK
jgi:ABC-2 type transport system ATP-binding protein